MNDSTQTLTLTDFVLARIAEDEAELVDVTPPISVMYDYEVKWQPRRIKAECEAKRAILTLHEPWSGVAGGREQTTCETCAGMPSWPCQTIRALATVYADHPNYRDEWKP